MKMAIVPAADELVALFCVESPDVRFEDTQQVTMTGATTIAPIDPSFLEVCERGTIEVVGATSPQPAVIGASVEGDVVVLRVEGERPRAVTIRLSGIRRGYRGTRFPLKTREQMHRNNTFWNQAQC